TLAKLEVIFGKEFLHPYQCASIVGQHDIPPILDDIYAEQHEISKKIVPAAVKTMRRYLALKAPAYRQFADQYYELINKSFHTPNERTRLSATTKHLFMLYPIQLVSNDRVASYLS